MGEKNTLDRGKGLHKSPEATGSLVVGVKERKPELPNPELKKNLRLERFREPEKHVKLEHYVKEFAVFPKSNRKLIRL